MSFPFFTRGSNNIDRLPSARGPPSERPWNRQTIFSSETIRLYDPSYPNFACSCSKKSVENMLRLIGKKECESIIEEQSSITIHCDFCNECYKYSEDEVEFIFNESEDSIKH